MGNLIKRKATMLSVKLILTRLEHTQIVIDLSMQYITRLVRIQINHVSYYLVIGGLRKSFD